jgi:ubiquinone/menaquinone biosynthesis C-methylase UbiE
LSTHHDTIVDQFTKQAMPFSTAPGIKDAAALQLVVDFSGAGPNDTVLDVACGPGLVVCAFARVVRHATGIDLTPAMIDRARALQAEQRLTNVSWQIGDVLPLPYPDASFSIASSRFAFHHLPDPLAVLREMTRVCAPGGKVVLVDLTASPDPQKAAAFHRMEVLRDPSHVRALTLAELQDLFAHSALPAPRAAFYQLAVEVEGLLQRSFPNPTDVDTIRDMFARSVDDDGMGLGTHRVGEQIRFAYSVAILVADKPVV